MIYLVFFLQVKTSSGLDDLTSSFNKMKIHNLRHNALGTYEIVMRYYFQDTKRQCGEDKIESLNDKEMEEGECSDSEDVSSESESSSDSSGRYFFFFFFQFYGFIYYSRIFLLFD